jgi:RNA polymerase sigma-B factor
LRDLVDHTVRVLSPRERRVLHLRFAEDLTQREIGAEIGVTQMHVSRILRQAVDRSRECAAVTRACTPEAPSA